MRMGPTQDERDRLPELAERARALHWLAMAMTVVPDTIAARDFEGARAELTLAVAAVSADLRDAKAVAISVAAWSERLDRIAITLDHILFMGGTNALGRRPVADLRQSLKALMPPTFLP